MGESKETSGELQYIVDIITALKDDASGIFLIQIYNQHIPLSWFLGLLTNNKGTWQSLGMAYNPCSGIQTMEISIYYMIPKQSQFEAQMKELIKRHSARRDDNDKERLEKSD